MVRHFLMGLGLVAYGSIASAQVSVLSNHELDEVLLTTQSVELKPFLPEYDSNGQVGGIEGALTGSNVPVVGSLGTAATTTAISRVNGGVVFEIPVTPLSNLISNLPRNIDVPLNIGH
jgi:hypothetical protein